jgi:hypothetical protein
MNIADIERLNAEEGERICALNGYSHYTVFPNGRDACIDRLLFTYAIYADLTIWGHGERWCYSDYAKALAALLAWDGEGEPDGWHRHPDTGRRRENGDPSKEEIAF